MNTEQLKDTQIEILQRNCNFYAEQFKKQLAINHELSLENSRLKALLKLSKRRANMKLLKNLCLL